MKRNQTATATIRVELRNGYHVNSHTPSDDYLVPLRLTWEPKLLKTVEVVYPEPRMEKYGFSETPLSVFTGDFDIATRFQVPAGAPPGPAIILGKLRYQACTDKSCLPPRNLEVRLPVDIR